MEEKKTPFYKIKETDLLIDINLLQEALSTYWGNYVMAYSVKTNSLPWLLTYLKKQGFYAEVVSQTEYDLVHRLGFPDCNIVYNGPIKDKKIFEKILVAGGYLNMDSSEEVTWLKELSMVYPNQSFGVGLRVNCDIASLCPEEELVEEERGRFGYCYENGVLKDAIEEIKKLPNVRVSGLHLHSSTQSRTTKVYAALAAMAVKITQEYKLELDYVDMGGGYFGGRSDKPDYLDYFKEICRELGQQFDKSKTVIIAEPGVSLISRAITFETRVKDVKEIGNHKFIVTDGSRTNLNPLVTSNNYPHHIEYQETQVPWEQRQIVKSQWICGFTCMEYDRLFECIDHRAILPGDKIIYDTAGGYTMCLNPLFIEYLPAVYVEKKEGTIFIAREAWGNEEYLQKNYYE